MAAMPSPLVATLQASTMHHTGRRSLPSRALLLMQRCCYVQQQQTAAAAAAAAVAGLIAAHLCPTKSTAQPPSPVSRQSAWGLTCSCMPLTPHLHAARNNTKQFDAKAAAVNCHGLSIVAHRITRQLLCNRVQIST